LKDDKFEKVLIILSGEIGKFRKIINQHQQAAM